MDGSQSLAATAAEPVRPRLASWIAAGESNFTRFGREIGKSGEAVRLYCLPFGDPKRCVPGDETLRRIKACTAGEIGVEDFYPPDVLRAPAAKPADEDWASRSFLDHGEAQ